MKINTKEVLKDLSGKELKSEDGPFTFGQALANILLSAKEGGKMKLFLLAQKLYQDKVVDIDISDLTLIESTVKSSEHYTALVLGQCELMLKGVKEDKK